MYGAVLWSDRFNSRALIWCEDQGNLAFFDGKSNSLSESFEFEEGDLVRFKVRDGGGMRLALEVKVISSEEYPHLANDLREARQAADAQSELILVSNDRKIVPFKHGSANSVRRDQAVPSGERKSRAV